MTTTLTAQPRRHSPSSPRPPRDLPVLFHLLDVSRPRGYSVKPAEPQPAYSLEPATGSLIAASSEPHADERLDEPSDLAASIAEAAQAPPAADELVQPSAEAADNAESAAEAAAATDEPASSAEAETPPATSDAVALRERAQARQRKRQAAGKDDWFASHGKYIAIGFVVALLATIYAARSRKPAPPEVAKPEHVHKHQTPDSSVRTASAEKSTQDKSTARPTVAITSVRPSQSTAGEAQTALHPPTIPQLAAQSEPSPASDGLFPWAQREEERVASRTGDVANAAAADAAPTAAPVSAEQHSYPSTPYPGDYRQLTAPAAAAQQPAASQPFYPTTNSPSGYRHERSGSGFH